MSLSHCKLGTQFSKDFRSAASTDKEVAASLLQGLSEVLYSLLPGHHVYDMTRHAILVSVPESGSDGPRLGKSSQGEWPEPIRTPQSQAMYNLVLKHCTEVSPKLIKHEDMNHVRCVSSVRSAERFVIVQPTTKGHCKGNATYRQRSSNPSA